MYEIFLSDFVILQIKVNIAGRQPTSSLKTFINVDGAWQIQLIQLTQHSKMLFCYSMHQIISLFDINIFVFDTQKTQTAFHSYNLYLYLQNENKVKLITLYLCGFYLSIVRHSRTDRIQLLTCTVHSPVQIIKQ